MYSETLLQPPRIGPQFPIYPELPQIIRKSGAAVTGRVYPAFTQQYAGNSTFRDREASYIYDANNVTLTDAFYLCRLVGAFPIPGDPLYGSIATLPLYSPTSGAGTSGNSITVSDGVVSFPGTTNIQFPTGTLVNLGGGLVQYIPANTGGDIHTYRTTGGRFTSPITTPISNSVLMPCGQIYLYPFIVPVTQKFNALQFYLTGAALTGGKVQLAVYNTANASNDTPLNKIVNTTDIPIDIGVPVLVNYNLPSAITLIPGLYYFGANTNLANSSHAQWATSTGTLHVLGLDPTLAIYFMWLDGTNLGANNGTAYGIWPATGAGMVTVHKTTDTQTGPIVAVAA